MDLKSDYEHFWSDLTVTVSRQAGSLHLDSVRCKLGDLEQRVRARHAFIDRIAFALYDPSDASVKGILATAHHDGLPPTYCRRLTETPGLAEIAASRCHRVLNHLQTQVDRESEHSRWLLAQGFRSSLTVPVEQDDRLLGFLFFDSRTVNAFPEAIVDDLLLLAHLIGIVVRQELASVEMLVGSLRLARQFAHLRDVETGCHLDRMSCYAHLIASEIAPARGQCEGFIELLRLFAPLHDIGKVGVPDDILHKPGPLDRRERSVMNSHVPMGLAMADRLIADFDLQGLPSIGMLRNVIAHHHELLDGSGYPGKLTEEAIPLEARIVATADILDALSCRRSYKPAWSLDDAMAEIRRMAGTKLDETCVNALFACRDEVARVHQTFLEEAA